MNKEQIKEYLDKGIDIAGAAVGTALGLAGGPLGAIAGSAAGTAITHGIKEIIKRQLSNRQEVRIAASTAYMLTGINSNLQNGGVIRTDDFFNDAERSSAEELFEGVLTKCKDEYQEKKIYHISKIFEQTIFDTNISAGTANHILSIAENFTYRKICVISFYGRKNEFDINELMQEPYLWYKNATFTFELEMLKQDIYELVNLGIIDAKSSLLVSNNFVAPNRYELSEIGSLIFSMMDLQSVATTDLNNIYQELTYKQEFGLSDNGTRNGRT